MNLIFNKNNNYFMNNLLYKRLIYNISKEVKNILNEHIQKFNPIDYDYEDNEIIDNQDIANITKFDYILYDNIVEQFNSLKIPKKLKIILLPNFFMNMYRYGFRPDYGFCYNYNFNSKKQFNNKEFINTIKSFKKVNQMYEVKLTFKYLDYFIERYNLTQTKVDKCKELLNSFINQLSICNIYLDIQINDYSITISCSTIEPDLLQHRRKGIITGIDEGLERIYTVLEKYINFLEEHINEIQKYK